MCDKHNGTKRWTHRPPGSNWGDFGPDDVIGRLNLITARKVLEGAAEIKEGKTFSLSLPLDVPGNPLLAPIRIPPKLYSSMIGDAELHSMRLGDRVPGATEVACDDYVFMALQYSSQWDGLAHVGGMFDVDGDGKPEAVYYNGYRAHEHVKGGINRGKDAGYMRFESPSAGPLGIENMAEHGVQGRAVMIDLHHHFGRKHHSVTYKELKEIFVADKVKVEPGDMVCIYTGFADMLWERGKDLDVQTMSHFTGLDGHDPDVLKWITDSGVACLIADNLSVESEPDPTRIRTGSHAQLPLHEHCLFKNGIHLGELWHLRELATWLRANKRSRFMLTAPPLRLPGAVGSPPMPVATV